MASTCCQASNLQGDIGGGRGGRTIPPTESLAHAIPLQQAGVGSATDVDGRTAHPTDSLLRAILFGKQGHERGQE